MGDFFLRQLKLSQGMFALVDDADFDRCNAHKWCVSLESRQTKHYAKRRRKVDEPGTSFAVYLHHFILEIIPAQLPPGYVVDHINHDGLLCVRANLEIITQEENMRRSPGWKKKGEPVLAYAGPDRSDEWI